jgi:hypothetical protein
MLFLGSETDWYAVSNTRDYDNWVHVYQAVRAAVKKASPNTKVGTCFQFERISGTVRCSFSRVICAGCATPSPHAAFPTCQITMSRAW